MSRKCFAIAVILALLVNVFGVIPAAAAPPEPDLTILDIDSWLRAQADEPCKFN